MSDSDPNRSDPRFDMRGYNWNWLAAIIAAIIVLLIAYSLVDRGTETATTPPSATTGQGTTTRPSSPNQ